MLGKRLLFRGHDLPLKSMLADHRQHRFRSDGLRLVANVEQVVFQISLDRLDTGKPCQGFLDLVRSSQSGEVEPLGHVLDVQG
jgi:hypothetical protein